MLIELACNGSIERRVDVDFLGIASPDLLDLVV